MKMIFQMLRRLYKSITARRVPRRTVMDVAATDSSLPPYVPNVVFDVDLVRPSIDLWLQTDAAHEVRRAFTLLEIGAIELSQFIADYERRLDVHTATPESSAWWQAVAVAYATDPLARVCVAEAITMRHLTLSRFGPYLTTHGPADFGKCLSVVDREANPGQAAGAMPRTVSDTRSWSYAELREQIDHVKNTRLDWSNTKGSARTWWEACEKENEQRLALLLRLVEELAARKATITDFYLSYVDSNTDNIQANLWYLDYTRLTREEDKIKREAAVASLQGRPVQAPSSKLANEVFLTPGITDTGGWNAQQIYDKVGEVKKALDWDNTTGSARKWWEAFENENKTRMPLVLRLAEELSVRKATITEFFLAYVYSKTDNIQANLCYLDYTRLKEEEAQKKKEAAALQLKKLQTSLRDQASAGQTAFRLSINKDSGESRSLTLCGENAVASLSDIFPDSDGSNQPAVLVAPVAVMLALVDLFVSWSEANWRINRVSTDQMSREGVMFEIAGLKEVLADFDTTDVGRKIELLKALVVQEFSPGNAQTTCLRELGEMLQCYEIYKMKLDETKDDEADDDDF